MTNYITDNEIKLEIIFEDGDIKKPKIVGTFINKNRPKKWVIDVYSKTGQDCGRLGWRVTGEMNNISLSVDLDFDGITNKASLIKKTDFDEYKITNNLYEILELSQPFIIGNINFKYFPDVCEEIPLPSPSVDIKETETINALNKSESYIYNF